MEDLFTASKSAVNLLGVISMSKGPHQWRLPLTVYQPRGKKNKRSNHSRSKGELLVLLFSSKFLIPSVSNVSQKKVLTYRS
ncbi:unnamed protein product [Trifolium pratense]|uniref:Uncharacterized protein n=1 Tax=Trifolium pratense TaxID=57577 RepID=A0ACB0JPP5_TRIPR|nr:unnamed protein product [Trifolium pratense]